MSSNRELLTIPETAKRLGVSRSTVYNFIERGHLDIVELPSSSRSSFGDIRISTTVIKRFIKDFTSKDNMVRCPKCGHRF